jgi:hypothetical protein
MAFETSYLRWNELVHDLTERTGLDAPVLCRTQFVKWFANPREMFPPKRSV